MQRNARTNIKAAWGGAGAFDVASLFGNLVVYGFVKHPRRRRSQRAFASGNVIARTGRSVFAALVARVSLRWVACQRVGTAA